MLEVPAKWTQPSATRSPPSRTAQEGSWKMEQLLSPSFHNTLEGGSSLCMGSRLLWAKGEEKRREIKWPPCAWAVNHLKEQKYFKWSWRSCLDRLQMSLFCCKLPQLPSGTGRSELAGLSTPRKVAAATAEGNLMTQITDVRTEGQRLLYPLRTGRFYLFPPKKCMWCSHLHSHCHRHTF